MADIITPQRTYAAGIRLTIFDMVSFTVDAVPQGRPNSSKDTAMRRVVLTDAGPVAVEQRYLTADGALYSEQDLGRARETGDGTLVPLDPEVVTRAKVGGLDKNEITLSVHPADQVDAACLTGANGYRLRPPRKASAAERGLYATIRAAIEAAPDKAFVGALRLRDSRATYRLIVWNDQLVLQELATPADLAEVDVVDAEPDEAKLAMAMTLVSSATVDFDPARYEHDAAAAFETAVAEAAPTVATSPKAPALTVVPNDPAAAMFEQALAALAPKKPAPRRRRKATPVEVAS
jgi:non-homologous end joining protein Ku